MLSIKGTFRDGIVQPNEYVESYNGQEVIITFLETDRPPEPPENNSDFEALMQLIEDFAIERKIAELAQQHDRYFYGMPHVEYDA
ncbi:hypothetical protein [Oscillatoria salina]|uniref:hypothetical protein n=1 Tax=Oscillatoria salina TaxID=331517 RepID=UPI0013B82318|nr:hypothetical protein [Oscillatoria salina]MBZ8181392.1 hypothetical protein [Oscillatoria salina IIICB1]NET91357.1 hypothetical protein [Kamptonema sp. SIO1D9]